MLGNSCKIDRRLRLYPASPETDDVLRRALLRAETHTLSLCGEELNRQQAARRLGTTVGKLRCLEKTGVIKPGRKGRAVVYDKEILSQARDALTKKK